MSYLNFKNVEYQVKLFVAAEEDHRQELTN